MKKIIEINNKKYEIDIIKDREFGYIFENKININIELNEFINLCNKAIDKTINSFNIKYKEFENRSIDYNDIKQDLILIIPMWLSKYRGESKWTTYLYRCLRNKVYNILRSDKNQKKKNNKLYNESILSDGLKKWLEEENRGDEDND